MPADQSLANFNFAGSTLGDTDEPQMESLESDYFGVIKASISRRRQEASVPPDVDWMDVKSAPNYLDLPCMGVHREYRAPWGKYIYGYEGIVEELAALDHVTFEIDVTETEEPIQTHPNFPELRRLYLWSSNLRRFSEFLPGTGKDKGKLVKNPMSGVEAYLVPGVIFRLTGVDKAVPDDLYTNVGLADEIPKIEGFEIPKTENRQWFKLGPKLRKRGNCVEWTKEWQLAGPNGINKNIYTEEFIWQTQPQDTATPVDTGDNVAYQGDPTPTGRRVV